MVAVALAVLIVSVLRYRKLLPWIAAAVILVLVLPWTQAYIGHFIEGVQLQDLSMKMRLGEYKDAFILIGRYPWLGVGFAGAPDIDIYTAVASMYLTIAERMGLIGLAVFLAIAGVLLARFWRWRKAAERFAGVGTAVVWHPRGHYRRFDCGISRIATFSASIFTIR